MVWWFVIASGAALFYSLVRQDRIANRKALRDAWRWHAVAIFALVVVGAVQAGLLALLVGLGPLGDLVPAWRRLAPSPEAAWIWGLHALLLGSPMVGLLALLAGRRSDVLWFTHLVLPQVAALWAVWTGSWLPG